MKSVTGIFFESKARYERMTEDGTQVKFNGLFVVDAQSFTECEKVMNEELPSFVSGEFEILTEGYAAYKEIFFSENEGDDRWYKTKVCFITLDEKTNKQKRTKVVYLVQAASIEGARKNVDEVMSGSMTDYDIVGLNEVYIEDVFLRKEKTDD